MPVLLALTPGDGRAERRDARDRAVATMTALAPMTRITDLDLPAGTTAAVSRQNLGPVNVVHLTGFDYGQVATARTIDGVPGTDLFQVYFSAEQLGMGVDALRACAAAIERSPLRHLVARHVLDLPRDDAAVPTVDIRRSVGSATVELVRAMLLGSARPEDLVGSEMSASHLRLCVERYVRQHLRDPGLGPAGIARAHAVSVRHLHSAWRNEPTTLWRWIVRCRLEAVREDLADPGLAHRSIAAVARGWCFPNPTHFARRFREEYGVTPREWRQITRGTGRQGFPGPAPPATGLT
jgi:AraC-like DNA-binding protein